MVIDQAYQKGRKTGKVRVKRKSLKALHVQTRACFRFRPTPEGAPRAVSEKKGVSPSSGFTVADVLIQPGAGRHLFFKVFFLTIDF